MTKFQQQINALIAEKVMNWTEIETVSDGMCKGILIGWPDWDGARTKQQVPRYCENIESAWTVVEAEGLFGFQLNQTIGDGSWLCVFRNDRDNPKFISADTAPLAICLAALDALGIERPMVK